MRRELKVVLMLTVVSFVFVMPVGVYLFTFSGEGMIGNFSLYVGAFILLPPVLLHKPLGLDMVQTVLYCAPLEFLWFALWVGLGRWWYLRKAKKAPPQAPPQV